MNAEQFRLAQQAADEAYAMTLEAGGTDEQAARDYAAVMQAYNNRLMDNTMRGIENVMNSADIAEMEARCAETASKTEEMIAMTRRIWRDAKPIAY